MIEDVYALVAKILSALSTQKNCLSLTACVQIYKCDNKGVYGLVAEVLSAISAQ